MRVRSSIRGCDRREVEASPGPSRSFSRRAEPRSSRPEAAFFRDPAAWACLARQAITPLVRGKGDGDGVRAWVPACATGEEAYTVAMLLSEALESVGRRCRIKVFATDVDAAAIDVARAGIYPAATLAGVSRERRARFFEKEGRRVRVTRELRDCVVFACQDLTRDPPFSRMDLVSCRGLLCALERDARARVLRLLHFALRPGGHLLLGRRETAGDEADLFAVASARARLYRRIGSTRSGDLELRFDAVSARTAAAAARLVTDGRGELSRTVPRRLAGDGAPARMVAGRRGEIVRSSGDPEHVVRGLEEELEWTRRRLDATVEEFETALDELRLSHEEMLTLNEELEASQEKLQASNEELTVANAQLEAKVGEIERAYDDLHNLMTSTNVPTLFLDPELRVRSFTPSVAKLFSLLPSDVGHPLSHIAQRFDDPQLLREAERVPRTLVPSQVEIRTADGGWYMRQILPYRTRDGRVDGVVITFSDVAADVVREARLYAESIVETVPRPLVVLDRELHVCSANGAFFETFRLAPAEVQGRCLYELGDGQWSIPELRSRLHGLAARHEAIEGLEVEQASPDLGKRTLLLNARVVRRGADRPDLFLLAVQDVSDVRRSERALRESEARSRAIVAAAPDAIFTIDGAGTILSVNPAGEAIFGHAAADMVGRSVAMLVPPGRERMLRERIGRKASRSKFHTVHEIEGQRRDGSTFPMEIILNAFADGAGPRVVAIVRDVSSRLAQERERRDHLAELAHAHRLSTVGELASGFAHEVGQPLTAVANDVDAAARLLRKGAGDARVLDLLAKASEEAVHAGNIVHRLRQFLQKRPGQSATFDLGEVLAESARLVSSEAERAGVALHVAPVTARLEVRGDRVQMKQVVVNLVHNAIDALREQRARDGVIELRAARHSAGGVEVVIEDTGPGLAPAVTETLLEPFVTTKPDGLGLGLSISRSIVQSHHGELVVANRSDGRTGVRARIELPAVGAGRRRGG